MSLKSSIACIFISKDLTFSFYSSSTGATPYSTPCKSANFMLYNFGICNSMVDQTRSEQRVPSYVHQGHAAKQESHQSQWGKNNLEIALNFFHFHIDIWESLILASISRDCRVMAEDTSNLKANFPNHIKSCFEQEQVKNQKAILLDLELSFKVSSMIISMRLKFFLALLWLS